MTASLEEKIKRLQGPILVLGASGFIGANLLRLILRYREDVVGTYFHAPAWRLEGIPPRNAVQTDLLVDANLDFLLGDLKPKTVFNCVAYGAYSFETNSALIYQTNFNLTEKLLDRLGPLELAAYVHAGSSSEYGDKATQPAETELPTPNSDYAVSKVATANLLYFHGRKKKFPCVNLRLYSIYGPLEDSSRLIPNLVRAGMEGKYPDLADPNVSRDFVYVEDACESFLDSALGLRQEFYGDSFNIGSGKKTTLADVAKTAGEIFKIKGAPRFNSIPNRKWDTPDWYADARKAKKILGWEAHTSFAEGLQATVTWYRGLEDKEEYRRSSKQFEMDAKHSVSAVVACYRDAQVLPELYDRLKKSLDALKVDYEIIFVNDNSFDETDGVIQDLSRKDRRVMGVSHSRSFGSHAAFRSGLEMSTKNSCVLLEGNLQDPPELIAQFVEKWREGYDVVFGRLVKKQASFFMGLAYSLFFKAFNYFSYLPIPPGAGDYSLIDRRVVRAILQFPERDFFFRGVRAYVGFKQIGVDYNQASGVPGRSGSLAKKMNWAKRGILSFSYTPLTIISFVGTLLFFISLGLAALQITLRLLYPEMTPKGATTVLLAILFFGSINLFAVAILGEYIAKIFEEVKQRPRFVRRSVIKGGEIRAVTENS